MKVVLSQWMKVQQEILIRWEYQTPTLSFKMTNNSLQILLTIKGGHYWCCIVFCTNPKINPIIKLFFKENNNYILECSHYI